MSKHAVPSVTLSHYSKLMVVYGGVGLGETFSDSHVLCCDSMTNMEWLPIVTSGAIAPARYGHSMVSLSMLCET